MVKKKTKKSKERTWALISCLLSIIGILIVYVNDKAENKYVKYYITQSIGLFITWIVLTTVIGFLPFINIILAPLAGIVLIILWILSILNSLSGHKKPLPLIGKFSERLDF